MPVTVTLIKGDVGGNPGHTGTHEDLLNAVDEFLTENLLDGDRFLITDHLTLSCGDDIGMLLIHRKGTDAPKIHELGWNALLAATKEAKNLGLYGAGQDLLKDAFSGNIRGMGPGIAEMEFEEREAEPMIAFLADKTSASAFTKPLCLSFSDPDTNAGLVRKEEIRRGYCFEILDSKKGTTAQFCMPEDLYKMRSFISFPRYMIQKIFTRDGEVAAVASTEQLTKIAEGEYKGKDDPGALVRCQGVFPAVGEILEPYAKVQLVQGWMRGIHWAPLIPVGMEDAVTTRFDGPPRIIAVGFQLHNGRIVRPVRDLFDDVAFDCVRQESLLAAEIMRKQGHFSPHVQDKEGDLEYFDPVDGIDWK